MQKCIIALANTNTKLHSYLSNGNFCSIRLEQFWLPHTSNSWATKQKTINVSKQIQNYFLTSFSWVVVTSAQIEAILTIWITSLSWKQALNYSASSLKSRKYRSQNLD